MTHYVIREIKYTVEGLEMTADYSEDNVVKATQFTLSINSDETTNSLRAKVRIALEERAGSGAPWPDIIIYGLDTI